MNRRQFFATSAALAAVTACEQRKVRLWLADVRQGDKELHNFSGLHLFS